MTKKTENKPAPTESTVILATFAHEVLMGAYRPDELPEKAKQALERVGMLSLDAIVDRVPSPEPDERAAFDEWFCKECDYPATTDTTPIASAYLPWRAWKARSLIAATKPEPASAPSEGAKAVMLRCVIAEMRDQASDTDHADSINDWADRLESVAPISPALQKSKGVTDEEILRLIGSVRMDVSDNDCIKIARAVLAATKGAHG